MLAERPVYASLPVPAMLDPVSYDYWSEQKLIVTVNGPSGAFSVDTGKPFARVGSHRSADVVVPGLMAEREVYLHLTSAGTLWLSLAESGTGGEMPHGCLRPGEALYLGPYWLSVQPDPRVKPAAVASSLRRSFPVVAVSIDGQESARGILTRSLTVFGHRLPSQVRIESESLSDVHVALYWHCGTLWAVDLCSVAGTLADGRPIEAAQISRGDTLTCGEVAVTYAGPAYADEVQRDSEQRVKDFGRLPTEIRRRVAEAGPREPDLPPIAEKPPEAVVAVAEPRNVEEIAGPEIGSAVAEQQAEWDPLRAELDAQRDALAASQERIQRDRRAIEEMQVALERQRNALREEEAAWRARQEAYESEWRQLRGELETRQDAVARAEDELRSDRRTRAELQDILAAQRQTLDRQQQEWLARQQTHESQWQRLREQMEQEQAAIVQSRQREQEAWLARRDEWMAQENQREIEWQQLRREIEQRQLQLAEEQEKFRRQQAELKAARAEWESAPPVLPLSMPPSERPAQVTEQAPTPVERPEVSLAEAAESIHAAEIPEPTEFVSPPPATSPAGEPEDESEELADDEYDEDEIDKSYEEVMERLFRVSKARTSWWRRTRSALARCFMRVTEGNVEESEE